jgi:hypothetical protein
MGEAGRGAEQDQAADRFGRLHRQVLRDIAAGGVADHVHRAGDAQMGQKLAHILHQSVHVQRQVGGRHLRFAMAAQVGADDAEMARQRRHRGIPALCRPHRGMQQQ